MSAASGQKVSLKQFLGDSMLFGLGGMADRLIGFLFLPVTASILGSSGFGIYNLYATTSAILFLLCAVGMHAAYFRFATDDSVTVNDPLKVLDVALVVIHAVTLVWIPLALTFATPLADWLIGAAEPWFVYWLCLRTYTDIIGALADCKLQADGKIKLFLSLRVPATVVIRLVSIGVLIEYRTPLAFAAAEAISALAVTIPIALVVLRGARPRIERKLAGQMVRYGAAMVPGLIAAWLLVAASRYILRAYSPDQIHDVGLFALAERFSSILLLIGQTLWLGWRRFAFRNMHHEDGPALLGQGITVYFAISAFATLGIAMLAPALTHLFIDPEFAPAAELIAPLTLSAFASIFAFPLRMGLIKLNHTMTMSLITIVVAVITIALAFGLIPRYAVAGAVAASLAGQIVGLALTWVLSQRQYAVRIENSRLAQLSVWFACAYVSARLLEPLGWLAVLAGSSLILAAMPYLLYRFGPFTAAERERIEGAVEPVLRRLRPS